MRYCIAVDGSSLSDNPTLVQIFEDEPKAQAAFETADLSEYDNPRVMSLAEYDELHRSHWLDEAGDLTVVDREKYRDRLNVLPPEHHVCEPYFERFSMSEHLSGSITRQYARMGPRGADHTLYVCRHVDASDRSTWISLQEVKTFRANCAQTAGGRPATDLRPERSIVRHVDGTVGVLVAREERCTDGGDIWEIHALSGLAFLDGAESARDLVDGSDVRYWATGDFEICETLERAYTCA